MSAVAHGQRYDSADRGRAHALFATGSVRKSTSCSIPHEPPQAIPSSSICRAAIAPTYSTFCKSCDDWLDGHARTARIVITLRVADEGRGEKPPSRSSRFATSLSKLVAHSAFTEKRAACSQAKWLFAREDFLADGNEPRVRGRNGSSHEKTLWPTGTSHVFAGEMDLRMRRLFGRRERVTRSRAKWIFACEDSLADGNAPGVRGRGEQLCTKTLSRLGTVSRGETGRLAPADRQRPHPG